jgi:hypothetical protein
MMIIYIVVKCENIEYDDFYRQKRRIIMRDDVWADHAKRLLKAELKRRGLGYRELAEKLAAMGTPESERNLANKISRGGFTAAFLLQCLAAIGCQSVRIDELAQAVDSV